MDTAESIRSRSTERDIGGSIVQEDVSGAQIIDLAPTETNKSNHSSFGKLKLPFGPPLRSPVPIGWSYDELQSEVNTLSNNIEGISSLVTAVTRNKIIEKAKV